MFRESGKNKGKEERYGDRKRLENQGKIEDSCFELWGAAEHGFGFATQAYMQCALGFLIGLNIK